MHKTKLSKKKKYYDKYRSTELFKHDEIIKNKLSVGDNCFLLHQAAAQDSIDEVQSIYYKINDSNKIHEVNSFDLQGCTPLHLASRFNRVKVINFLLDSGATIDTPSIKENNTALLLAAKFNMTDAAKCLCERGANVNIKNARGFTALHLAARRGNEEICNILLSYRCNVNAEDKEKRYSGYEQFTSLPLAAREEVCNVNAEDNAKCTPLHMAILSGSEAVTKLLLKNRANVYARDSEGDAPIHYAAALNQGELIVLLTKGALAIVEKKLWEITQRRYVNLRTEKKDFNLKKDAALHIAARAGYLDTVKTLVSIGANVNICSATNSTPLHLAAINGDTAMVEYLLEYSAKTNVYDHQNMTPAHKACQFSRLDVLKLLIERGALVDSKDCNCFTPLMWAVSKGQNDIVEYLLANGANLGVSDMNMKNVLHLAIEKQNTSTLQLLLKYKGASLVNDPDKDFKRPLHYAAMTNDVEAIKILIQNLADINVTDNEEKTALHTAAEYGHFSSLLILVQNSSRNINGTDEKGRSPLHHAAKKGWEKTAHTLIEMGAQISGRDDSNWTPLDYAANYGHSKIVLKLINNGASVDGVDPSKVTPLHRASINGHVDCINILLSHGASISFQNKDGKNCLDLAIENRHTEACMIFIMHERWEEALNNVDNEGKSPMEKLISLAPDIAEIVLEKCVKYSKLDENLKEYYIRYDFKYLDSPSKNQSREQYFGPSSMIEFNRENLLSHPLTVQLINNKWSRHGRWIHLISLFVYILFVSMLTGLLLIDEEKHLLMEERKQPTGKSSFEKIVPYLAIVFTAIEICKEVAQAYILKKEYLEDLSNYLELILYSSTLIYMVAYLEDRDLSEKGKYWTELKWNAGAIAIFFAWTNLLLYLKRDAFFGLYVVMIIEVFKSLMSVIMVFCLIITAFSLSFFVLLGVKSQKAFYNPGRSIMKTIAMTLGESNFDIIFNNTYLNRTGTNREYKYELEYPHMSYILFTLFLIVCPIVLMNLLVGLAVGNIADVRKSAYIIMLKAQVDILKALESKYPLKLMKKDYCRQITVYPNLVSWKMRILNWFGQTNYRSLKDKQEKRSRWKKGVAKELELQHIEFNIQKKRMQTVHSLIKIFTHKMAGMKKKMVRFLRLTPDISETELLNCGEATELPSPDHSNESNEDKIFGEANQKDSQKSINKSNSKVRHPKIMSFITRVRPEPNQSVNGRSRAFTDSEVLASNHSQPNSDDVNKYEKGLFPKNDQKTVNRSKGKKKLEEKKSLKDIILSRVNIKEEDERYGLLDSGLNIIVPESRERVSIFSLPNYLLDFSKGKYKHMSRTGTEIIESDNDTEKFSLHLAAKEGAIDRIQEIVNGYEYKKCMSLVEFINARDKWNGFNALHLAARYNQVNVVEFLLTNGAYINDPDGEDGNTPLLLAAKYGKTNTAKLLIDKGADVMFQNNYGSTALHYASRRGNKPLVLVILNAPNININVQDINKATPLHLAICGGCDSVVDILINNGANVFATDNNGQGPIHYAAASTADTLRAELKKGDSFSSDKKRIENVSSSIITDLIQLLLNGVSKNVHQNDFLLNQKKTIEFVNSRTNMNDTPLHVAARCGNEKFIKKLIYHGADVNAQTDSGSTPLHLAAINGQTNVVNMLLNNISNIQALDNDFMTPLHRACQFGRLPVVSLLSERGASLEVKDKNNYTPVMCAVWKGHVKVIKYLIDQGVQINLTDVNNKNVFHIAIQENQFEALEILLEQDLLNKINDVDNIYRTPVHYAAIDGNVQALEILINKNALIDVRENQERTPLHLSSEHGHLTCVKLLISTSAAEINSTDAQGMTPLHLAASNDHRKVVELLIESGADVCLRDNQGWSPLDYAARNGHEKSLQILLDNGASVDGCNESCYTPLHHASLEGHVECILTLLEHGASIQRQTIDEEKNCLDLAVENSEKEACMAIMKHKRWREALFNIDSKGTHIMEKIIELVPEVGEVALNNCITYSNLDKKHSDYSIEYNFEIVDADPVNCRKSFFAPLSIIRFQRGKLLTHPLIVELINRRWSRMGRWMFLCSLTFYLIFVGLITTLAVEDKIYQLDPVKHKHPEHKALLRSIAIFTLVIAIMQFIFKLILAKYIGKSYMFNPAKILDFFLYISATMFLVPFIACKIGEKSFLESMKWQAGSVSILLGWCKLLIYMQNLPFLGLYVVMFMEVLYTLLKVLVIFCIMLFGFALSFYSLFNYQKSFNNFGHVVIKTFVMMLGEINYDSIFTEYYDNVPKASNGAQHSMFLAIIIFLLFALIMIIVLMNLLVGLAVGDIESVRKNAYLRVLQRKVYLLNILDRTYPRFIREYTYQKSYIQKPNQRNWYKMLMLWMGKFHKKVLIDDRVDAKKDLIIREFAANREAILTQNQRTKSILDDLEKQLERNRKIAKCIANNSKLENSNT